MLRLGTDQVDFLLGSVDQKIMWSGERLFVDHRVRLSVSVAMRCYQLLWRLLNYSRDRFTSVDLGNDLLKRV